MAATNSRDRFASFAKGYSPLQIAIAGLLAVGVILGSLFVFRAATAPTYAVLYSGLSQEDAAAVVEQLTVQGVTYELGAGGATISVPAEQVDQLRLAMAGAGLPKTSVVGYELLDGQSLTTSSFREQVNYQRALEGELARTLASMDGVEAASVRLVMPEERAFSTQSRPASAAVQLTTSQPLTDDQVQAVVHLVASSVPDLSPADVTVTDASGVLLAGGDANSAATGSKAQAQLEAKLTAAADTMLADVLGSGLSVVRVSADLVRDDVTSQSEVFDPNRIAVGAQTTTNETYTSTETDAAGGTVVANPQPGQPANAGSSSNTQYSNESTTVENKVTRTVTETKSPPGTVRKLTVAVAVDDTVTVQPADIQALVANAVGLDVARGDTIVVTKMPFAKPDEEPAPVEPEAPLLNGMLPSIIGGVLLVLISLGLLLRLRSKKQPLDDSELLAAQLAAAQAAVPAAESRPSRTQADQLLDRVDSSPQEAANVLRGWLAEDDAARTK